MFLLGSALEPSEKLDLRQIRSRQCLSNRLVKSFNSPTLRSAKRERVACKPEPHVSFRHSLFFPRFSEKNENSLSKDAQHKALDRTIRCDHSMHDSSRNSLHADEWDGFEGFDDLVVTPPQRSGRSRTWQGQQEYCQDANAAAK